MTRSTYDRDHFIAKIVVAHVVIAIIALMHFVGEDVKIVLEAAVVYIWFFGINFVGHIVETIRHHKHSHNHY